VSELERVNPPFSRSAETDLLLKRFVAMGTGEELAYADAEQIIKVNPQTERGRGITTSSRLMALREHHVVIECVRNYGFRRASDPDKIRLANG
jgi:hypothetical protein